MKNTWDRRNQDKYIKVYYFYIEYSVYVEIYISKYSDNTKNAWFNETNKSSIRTLSDFKKYIKNQTILSWNTEE